MTESPLEQGSLERLGISLEVSPDADVLTPGKVKAVRFRESKPKGYAFPDVESFVYDFVIPSITWYAETLHGRNLAIHKLGEELDRVEVDNANLRASLEQSSLRETLSESLDSDSKDEEYERLFRSHETLKEENRILREQGGSSAVPGEEAYSAEEVESIVNAEINKVREDERQKMIKAVAAARTAAAANAGQFTQADLDAAVATALASHVVPQQSFDGFYTEEEVNEAISQALSKQVHTQPQGKTDAEVAAAVAVAVRRAREETREATLAEVALEAQELHTQEDLDAAVAEAVAEVEARHLSEQDSELEARRIEDLTDEGDVRARAEATTLRTDLDVALQHIDSLEAYIEQLTGEAVEVAVAPQKKELPPITAEDLL